MMNMKNFITILFTILLVAVTGCQHEDIWDKLNDHEQRIEQLEKLCRELNSNLEAIQAVLAAVQQHDYVTEVMKVMEDGVEVGYSITFAKGGTVTIYHGADGADGSVPRIGVKKASDGAYYWTSDGDWMTDDQGNMIPASVADPDADYIVPQFRVAEGVWYVSLDNGNTWRRIESNDADPFFQNVTFDGHALVLTLADGTVLSIPYGADSKTVDLFIFMGQSNMVGRGVAAEAPKVPEGWGYEYKAISDPGKLLPVVEPFGLDEENSQSGVVDNRRSGSMVSAFVNTYYERTGVPVVGVSCSKGGTTTAFWKPGDAPLNDAISRYKEAEKWLEDNGYTIRKKYMFWLQGETDATNKLSADNYRKNLKALVNEMLIKTSLEKCMMVRVGKLGKTVTEAFTICDDIIDVQTELCREYKEFIMASTMAAGFVEDGIMFDYWHYTQEGYNMLGDDVAKNVAFYVNNGIEPYMYDPHNANLYYPVTKHKSLIEELEQPEEPGEPEEEDPDYDFSNTTWYLDHTKNKSKFTSSCNIEGRGWAIAESNAAYDHLIGKPINTAAFFTNKTSQTVTVIKMASYGADAGEVIATITATIPSAAKQLAVIYFPEVTLKDGEYLSLFSQEDKNIQFYYSTSSVQDANGIVDSGFNSRLPILYGSGTSWTLTSNMSLGWSFGYTDHFAGKKITCIGDSITAGSGTTKTYWSILDEILDPESMTGMGVAGSCVSATSDYMTSNSPLISRYTSIPASDIITIYMGTNDYGHETPMGTINDTEDISFYGALNVIIPGIKNAHPDAQLVWITPTHRYGFGTSKILGTAFTYDYIPNGRGHSLGDYVSAIKDVCKKNSVPVIDLFDLSGMDPSLSEVRSAYMPDGLHPNAAGHEKIAAIIAKSLKDIACGVNDDSGSNEDLNNSTGEW